MDIKERFYANLNMIREEVEQLDEISAEKAEKAYQKTMKRMEWHDSVAGVMRHGGYKDAEKGALERSAKLRKKAVKFANYIDKKKMNEEEQLDETQDTLAGGLRRTDRPDLDLSKEPLSKKGKLSGNTKKWMKAFSASSRSLYSRKLSGPKGQLPEE